MITLPNDNYKHQYVIKAKIYLHNSYTTQIHIIHWHNLQIIYLFQGSKRPPTDVADHLMDLSWMTVDARVYRSPLQWRRPAMSCLAHLIGGQGPTDRALLPAEGGTSVVMWNVSGNMLSTRWRFCRTPTAPSPPPSEVSSATPQTAPLPGRSSLGPRYENS